MEKRVCTKDVKANSDVMLRGWVKQVRDLGGLKFFLLRDRDGTIQVTAKKGAVSDRVFGFIEQLDREDYVEVSGKTKEARQAPRRVEVVPDSIRIISKAETPLPIDIDDKIKSGLDKRLDWRALDLRNPKNTAIFKIQAKIVESMQNWLNKRGYIQVFTPCLMGAASESGAEVFPVVYYDKEAFLRQDPQLHRQLTILGGFERIYDLGPSWRAEPSHTSRHLTEHRGMAVEFVLEDERDMMKVEESVVVAALKAVNRDCRDELDVLGARVKIPETPFPELRFPKIYDILERMGEEVRRGDEYSREGEKLLQEYVNKKYHSDFFFVNRFPFAAKPFYVMRVDEEPEWARSVDLLYKGLEISSGGQREHRYEKIVQQAKEKAMDTNKLEWFIRFFKYGAPPHGGFCLGIERVTQQLLEIHNVREACLFPRDPERIEP